MLLIFTLSTFRYNQSSHVEKHLKKRYNGVMNSLGMTSAYSAYTAAANSVYDSASTLPIKSTQDSSAEVKTEDKSVEDINDVAIISDKAKALSDADTTTVKGDIIETNLLSSHASSSTDTTNKSDDSSTPKAKSKKGEALTPEQEQEVRELKARDAEVKAHEQAHIAASAGINASAPTYNYQTGPDGVQYAIGGEVNISFSQGNDPQENLNNAETMKAAALAPADPSSQDLSVASNADKMIQEAKQQIAAKQEEPAANANTSDAAATADSQNTDTAETIGSTASAEQPAATSLLS